MSEPRQNCASCNKTGSGTELKLCARCLGTAYCSRACQREHWKTHKHNCPATSTVPTIPIFKASSNQQSDLCYEVRTVPGKGQGLVATSEIPRGTRILSESPLFLVPRDANSHDVVQRVIRNGVQTLNEEQQKAFHQLHNVFDDENDPAVGIVRTNALPLGAGAAHGGLFLQAARINHACNNNAQNTWNSKTRRLTVHACRDIKKGEEICISYLAGSENRTSRRRHLEARFRFLCTCMLCSLPEVQQKASDKRLDEITRLDGIVGNGMSIVTTPLACLNHLRTMLQLIEQELITDARVPRAYYDALQVSIAHGDQARAQVFAERAYRERTLLEGDDSPEAERLKGFIERPSTHRLYGTTMKWKQEQAKIPRDKSAEDFEAWLWKRR